MRRLAQWCVTYRLTVLGLWLLAVIGLGAVSIAAGTDYNDDFSLPGTDSGAALAVLEDAFPGQGGETDTVVWQVPSGTTVDDAAVRERMTAALDEIARIDGVAAVASPYGPEGESQISRDGRTAYATVTFESVVPRLAAVEELVETAHRARTGGLAVEVGGPTVGEIPGEAEVNSELVGIAAAAVILLLAFGSLLSMLLPIVIALFALAPALMVIGLISHGMAISTIAPVLGTLIGLGVGIDYALFIVTRHRDGLKAGLSVREAATRALDTSGRAVVFAGGTVCAALLGLLVLDVSFLAGIALGSAIAVLLTVAAAATLLPAMLGIVGLRVLSRRERRRLATADPTSPATPASPAGATGATDAAAPGAAHDATDTADPAVVAGAANPADATGATGPGGAAGGAKVRTGLWARWAALSARRPALLATVAAVGMLVLALPALSVRLGFPDQGIDPPPTTTRQAYDLLAEGFGPGFNGPLQLVAELRSPDDLAGFEQLGTQVAGLAGVAAVGPAVPSPEGAVAIIEVVPATSPQDEATAELIRKLREEVVPAAEQGRTLRVYVAGQTAVLEDFTTVLRGDLPLFVALVVGLGCVLLLIAFRSLLIPLTAAVMNLLAAAATMGIVVAVFQWGWAADLIGVGSGPIEVFLPVILLAILFGLAMDYQVFLVSRMHEEWLHTRDNRRAVIVGQVETSRVITAAAAIMICVFSSFVLQENRVVSEMGLGLAAAIALDAFVLRTMLVPTVMHLLGRANWWIPRWLDRVLPHLSVEPHEAPRDKGGPSTAPRDKDQPSAAPSDKGGAGADR